MASNQAILPLDDYVAACDAVRAKGGATSAAIKSGEMAAAIAAIPGPKPEQEKTASTTKNGAVEVTPDPGKVMTKATVTVNVPERKPEQAYNKTYTSNGSYPVTPDPGKVITGGTIKVNVPSKPPVIKPITITKNGTTTAPAGTDGYSPVTVNVPTGGGEDIPFCTVTCNSGGGFPEMVVAVTEIADGKLKLVQFVGDGEKIVKIPCGTIVYAEGIGGERPTFSGGWGRITVSTSDSNVRVTPAAPTDGLRIN